MASPIINDIVKIAERVLVALSGYDTRMHTPEALALVMRTGAAESGYRRLKQAAGGPALSFWQIEPDTAIDVLLNFVIVRKELREILSSLNPLALDPDKLPEIIESDIAVAIFFCRLVYWRSPGSIPSTLEEQAKCWKLYYNTPAGRGTTEHFIDGSHTNGLGKAWSA